MSGFFYRLLIGFGQTTLGYSEALSRCDRGSRLLDIGTGDGYALLRNASIIRERNLRIVCMEPDKKAADILEKDIANHGLDELISVRTEYLEFAAVREFDVCLCITTLICFPDTAARRECVEKLLSHVKPGGKVLIHQTLYGGLNSVFLLTRYLTSYTVYHLYRPLYVNDLSGLFKDKLWDVEQIHWLAPFMLFTVRDPTPTALAQ
mmetsp:Transcript_4300/g.12979  ORF Transcript_4300/g.12979 Transcript_4300/m.12979 type:complete len:206 (-) Transcript_4300:862-1479(-)